MRLSYWREMIERPLVGVGSSRLPCGLPDQQAESEWAMGAGMACLQLPAERKQQNERRPRRRGRATKEPLRHHPLASPPRLSSPNRNVSDFSNLEMSERW